MVLDDLSTERKENLASGIQLFVGDVLNVELVEKLAIGYMGIFHLAAIASVPRCNDSWVDSHRINQTGTVAVLNASRMSGLNGAGQSIATVTANLGVGRSDVEHLQGSAFDSILVHRHTALPHAFSPHSVTLMQLRFASFAVNSSQRDLHPQECARAGRTKKKGQQHQRLAFFLNTV